MKKNIFLMGKVYPKNTPMNEIKRDVEARLLDYTKVQIGVELNELSANELEIILHRGLQEKMEPGTIIEQDTWLLSGEGYNGFMPEYRLPMVGHIVPNAIYTVPTDDFIDNYKRNASFYGSSRVKDVFIDEQPNYLRMVVKYG